MNTNETRNTKKSMRASGLSLLLCVVMLIGTTFAWFTDSITNSGNKIEAGTLAITGTVASVEAEATKKPFTIEGINGGNAFGFGEALDIEDKNEQGEDVNKIMNESLWEPGKTSAKLLTVKNSGNLAAKIKLNFNVKDGGLEDALWYDFVQVSDGNVSGKFEKREMSTLKSFAEKMEFPLPADSSLQFILLYGMEETAGNEYQGKTFEADVSIVATQAAVEEDGFGNNKYDEHATYPVADITEFKDALNNANNGDTISLTGNLELKEMMSIKKDLTIDGNGNTIISEKPVYVGATNDVVIANVEFTKPSNINNNASSLYAVGLEGSLTLKNCRFVDFQWEGVQVTPKAGATIVVDGCYFSNSKKMNESGIETKRYLQVEVTDRKIEIDNIRLQLTNNTFENVVYSEKNGEGYFSDSAVTSCGILHNNIKCEGNVFKGDVQENAIENPEIIWISDGWDTNSLMYDGFDVKQ